MNKSKYQAALNFIVVATNGGDGVVKELNTLQELVDKFELVEKQNRIEKALDKACEKLEELSYVKGVGQVGMCYVEWKGELLNDL